MDNCQLELGPRPSSARGSACPLVRPAFEVIGSSLRFRTALLGADSGIAYDCTGKRPSGVVWRRSGECRNSRIPGESHASAGVRGDWAFSIHPKSHVLRRDITLCGSWLVAAVDFDLIVFCISVPGIPLGGVMGRGTGSGKAIW
jgi:hypothetical protein